VVDVGSGVERSFGCDVASGLGTDMEKMIRKGRRSSAILVT